MFLCFLLCIHVNFARTRVVPMNVKFVYLKLVSCRFFIRSVPVTPSDPY